MLGAGKENVTAGGGRVVSDAKGPEKQKRTRLFSSSAQIGSLLDGKKKNVQEKISLRF